MPEATTATQPAPATPAAPPTPAPLDPGTSPFQKAVRAGMRGDPLPTPGGEPAKPDVKPEPAKAAASTEPPKPDATTPPPADSDDVPENFTAAKAADWKRVKDSRDQWKNKASDYEKRVAEYEAKLKKLESVNPEELGKKLEMTAKERDDMLARVERLNIEHSPRFQQHFNPRFERVTKNIQDIAGDQAELALAIANAKPGKWRESQLETLLESFESQGKKLRLVSALDAYEALNAEKESVLANAKSEHARLQEQEKQEAIAEQEKRKKAREVIADQLLARAEKLDAFKTIEGNEEHNAIVEANRKLLRKFATQDGLTVDEYHEAAIAAGEAKHLKSVLAAITKERDELKAAVATMTKGNPGLRGSGESSSGGEPTTFKDRVHQVMKGI